MRKNTEKSISLEQSFSQVIISDIPERCELIMKIQERYSFRISEILRLNIESLFEDFKILIKLSKTNDFIFIRDIEIYTQLEKFFNLTPTKKLEISYKEYYYFLLKYHPEKIIHVENHSKKVTHSFRYRNIRNIQKVNPNPKVLKAVLHHKSVKSQEYYLRKNIKP